MKKVISPLVVRTTPIVDIERRMALKTSLLCGLEYLLGSVLVGCDGSTIGERNSDSGRYGPLQSPDQNGIRLPVGFNARIVAMSGITPLVGSGHIWHAGPDGGATFAVPDGGFIYVSNSEMSNSAGGVGALRFDESANLIASYSILDGTTLNCAGGPTPWGTWLSCEEFPEGYVWECDPFGSAAAIQRPALGRFEHEAAAVDPHTGVIYLSEDDPNGKLYRFTPSAYRIGSPPDLSAGRLEVAQLIDGEEGAVIWHEISDPIGVVVPTREQVPESTTFNRGEGLWYSSGGIYMSTTGDNRIWMYDIASNFIRILYDDNFFAKPVLSGVDNLTISSTGDIYVAEDNDEAQLVLLDKSGNVSPFLQLIGHIDSEIAGPAFDPSGNRLYFSSQKGFTGRRQDGITFEITGPFLTS